jgi:uncharacterized protein (TIGR02444 family)
MARILADLTQIPASGFPMQSPSSLPSLPESLWDFSLAFYAKPGVEDCCLQLQDNYRVNVNVLLWCVWLGFRGYELNQVYLDEALALISPWDNHYVRPLRDLRRQMKVEFGTGDAGVEAARTTIKQAELQAERQLQHWLEQRVKQWGTPSTANRQTLSKNIHVYLASLGIAKQVITQVEELINQLL